MALRTRQELLKDLATNYVTQTTLDSGSKFSEHCCFFLALSLYRERKVAFEFYPYLVLFLYRERQGK